uniref:Uncharacterized protein n=1 Tax=viral metagenome TaxID=1070528 RepID=A0A2V0R9Z8_9ZZZZ
MTEGRRNSVCRPALPVIVAVPTSGKTWLCNKYPSYFWDPEREVMDWKALSSRERRDAVMNILISFPNLKVVTSWWCTELMPFIGTMFYRHTLEVSLKSQERERNGGKKAFSMDAIVGWKIELQADRLCREGVPLYWLNMDEHLSDYILCSKEKEILDGKR